MSKNTLEQALRNKSFIGGEIEIQEPDKIYRGPIKKIKFTKDSVRFHLLWCAHRSFSTEKWIVANTETAAILSKRTTTVTPLGCGGLTLHNPEIITGNIFLKDGNKLDPADVEGLDLSNLPKPTVVRVG